MNGGENLDCLDLVLVDVGWGINGLAMGNDVWMGDWCVGVECLWEDRGRSSKGLLLGE